MRNSHKLYLWGLYSMRYYKLEPIGQIRSITINFRHKWKHRSMDYKMKLGFNLRCLDVQDTSGKYTLVWAVTIIPTTSIQDWVEWWLQTCSCHELSMSVERQRSTSKNAACCGNEKRTQDTHKLKSFALEKKWLVKRSQAEYKCNHRRRKLRQLVSFEKLQVTVKMRWTLCHEICLLHSAGFLLSRVTFTEHCQVLWAGIKSIIASHSQVLMVELQCEVSI